MGYKVQVNKISLVFKLGYSHRIIYKSLKDTLISYHTRNFFDIQSRSLANINRIISILQKLGKSNSYKKKGIFIKGSFISLKSSSKKSKF